MAEGGRRKEMNQETKEELEISKLVTMTMTQECKKDGWFGKKSDNLCFIDAKGKGLAGQPSTHQAG